MVKLVLFDIDGTLIRSGGAGVQAFERTFTEIFGMKEATRRMKFAGRTDVSLVLHVRDKKKRGAVVAWSGLPGLTGAIDGRVIRFDAPLRALRSRLSREVDTWFVTATCRGRSSILRLVPL